ncbi:hypothetical protein NDU88_000252 [Pleurodeles waltl]|uniref:Uncharacterized protein n=1 Tax=Pleurodeles waltl TaxID=8319 RepID=A0AAV7S541_PLEWA|nr:hypothetical protein NDU88_000252 [Pleurodeles waltl]
MASSTSPEHGVQEVLCLLAQAGHLDLVAGSGSSVRLVWHAFSRMAAAIHACWLPRSKKSASAGAEVGASGDMEGRSGAGAGPQVISDMEHPGLAQEDKAPQGIIKGSAGHGSQRMKGLKAPTPKKGLERAPNSGADVTGRKASDSHGLTIDTVERAGPSQNGSGAGDLWEQKSEVRQQHGQQEAFSAPGDGQHLLLGFCGWLARAPEALQKQWREAGLMGKGEWAPRGGHIEGYTDAFGTNSAAETAASLEGQQGAWSTLTEAQLEWSEDEGLSGPVWGERERETEKSVFPQAGWRDATSRRMASAPQVQVLEQKAVEGGSRGRCAPDLSLMLQVSGACNYADSGEFGTPHLP